MHTINNFPVKTSCYINYYNDVGFLKLLSDTGQLDIYDEVVIVDGPYEYCSLLNFGITESLFLENDAWGGHFLNQPRIRYIKGIWADEKIKRMTGYENCTHEFIVLHDSDEFYDFQIKELVEFVNSDKAVAFFRCQNLFHDGYLGSKRLVTCEEELPLKGFVFKKSLISPLIHLDHLWLIGVEQNKPEHKLVYLTPIAKGYHLTQMRDQQGQKQKYLFYTGLNLKGGVRDEFVADVLEVLMNHVENGLITLEDAHAIYLRGVLGYTGLPSPENNIILQNRIVFSEHLEKIVEKAIAARNKSSQTVYQFINGFPSYIYFPCQANSLTIKCAEPNKLSAKYFEIRLDKPMIGSFIPLDLDGGVCILNPNHVNSIGWLTEFVYRTGNPIDTNELPVRVEITVTN